MTNATIVKIEEIADDMTQALANLAKVNNQKVKMVNIIKASSDAKEFEEFTKATEADIKKNELQYKTLLSHRDTLMSLKKKYDNANDELKPVIEEVIHDIFVAFNVIEDTVTEA